MINPVVPVGMLTVADAVTLPVIANADPLEALLSDTTRPTPARESVNFSPSTAVAVDDVVVAAATALGIAGANLPRRITSDIMPTAVSAGIVLPDNASDSEVKNRETATMIEEASAGAGTTEIFDCCAGKKVTGGSGCPTGVATEVVRAGWAAVGAGVDIAYTT